MLRPRCPRRLWHWNYEGTLHSYAAGNEDNEGRMMIWLKNNRRGGSTRRFPDRMLLSGTSGPLFDYTVP